MIVQGVSRDIQFVQTLERMPRSAPLGTRCSCSYCLHRCRTISPKVRPVGMVALPGLSEVARPYEGILAARSIWPVVILLRCLDQSSNETLQECNVIV